MQHLEGACLLCGEPLEYTEQAQRMKCVFCGQSFESYASCEAGHYVCDACHAEKGLEQVKSICSQTSSSNPITIIQEIMNSPYIYMHGPEHHTMVGCTLLAAYHNAGGEIDLQKSLAEMQARGSQYPGGACGYWGCCGAAVSVGMFCSIITGATPLAIDTWGLSNRMTAAVLETIGKIGGPRCCKRNSFTAIKVAVEKVQEFFGVQMMLPESIRCNYQQFNKECIGKRCPYHPINL